MFLVVECGWKPHDGSVTPVFKLRRLPRGISFLPAVPPCPLCFERLNTEATESLCDLRVESFLATEDTERLV
jgi:hypothetical protein